MSVSDPLIRELKGYTRKFTESAANIEDDTEGLAQFCKCLEKCLQKGVLPHLDFIGSSSYPEAWKWMEDIAKVKDDALISYASIVEDVTDNKRVQENVGRLRLVLRTCLNRKCLHVPVGYLVRTPNLALDYYRRDSIIGDEILGEILYSVLLQISELKFRLNLRNASFLDDTWDLPICIAVDLVPCKTLGISLCFVKGRALVVKLEKNSVAAEDGKIEIGDVLSEINGQTVCSEVRSHLSKILKKNSCQPISLFIVKFRRRDEIFVPIESMIECSGLTHMKNLLHTMKAIDLSAVAHKSKPSPQYRRENSTLLDTKYHGLINYCGSVKIGREGDVRQIDGAMRQLFEMKNIDRIPVRFECLELGIRIFRIPDNKEILRKSYMEISSCGRSDLFPGYFAFISGQTVDGGVTHFEAHVFQNDTDESKTRAILQSLGQGFYRTHFAV
ncbi:hypothetical protein QAD02_014316 [Eretmocerus hayati]|uniref:Uncharacterized protein n=1 Tax=Eretmocerus hayati TaxID=131215 RepID=A0ACC2P7G9_9HYME|nr:hypothetical protein QAD02_014316 [Eretmocerus hayati]